MENDIQKNPTYEGTVIWFQRGIGFLEFFKNDIQQKDMFVHYSDISMTGFKNLYKGQKVSFQIGVNKNGDPKAINVTVLKSNSSPPTNYF